ncbi:MAG: thioesterase [Verrucomicrobia bacterium]|nr:MAG: thioesterase [Verrucomicrobiota bacterium]
MKQTPPIGTVGEIRFVVTAQHAIDFADEVMPAVLSTPWLVWFLEHAAREAVLPFLDPEESTVGIEVDIRHTAPTPVGQEVVCRARVIGAEGRRVLFQLEAYDPRERIARGSHRLQVIRKERLAEVVRRKQAPEPGAS